MFISQRPLKCLVTLGIISFWLVMMSLLLKREALPRLQAARQEPGAGQSYEALLTNARQTRTSQMGIYWLSLDRRVGTTATTIRRVGDMHQINTQTRIATGLIGKLFLLPERENETQTVGSAGQILITSRTVVGPEFNLVSFRARVTGEPGMRTLASIDGGMGGGKLHVTLTDNSGRTFEREIPFDSRTVISQVFSTSVSQGDLYVGRRWQVRMLNPFMGTYETAMAEVTGEESIEWNGRQHDTFVVKTSWGNWTSTAWVDRDGSVLRQRAPLGVILVRENPKSDASGDEKAPQNDRD